MDEIDAMLDKEFGITEETVDVDTNETDVDTDVDTDVNTDAEDSDSENETTTTEQETQDNNDADEEKVSDNDVDANQDVEPNKQKLTKDDKEVNAFAKLRNEVKEEKQRADKESEFIRELAASYGYSDVEKFKADVKKAQMEKEAEEKGIDKEVYMQLQSQAEKIKKLEQLNEQKDIEVKAINFRNSVENAVKNYGVSKDVIINRLEKAGFTVDDVLASPNIDLVIKGLLVDEIKNISKQEQIKDIKKLDNFTDDVHNNNGGETTMSLDDIIKEEMKQYKADNYFE